MTLLLFLLVALLPLSAVECTACWAGQTVQGAECIFDIPMAGGPEMEITYKVNANLSKVCCEALQCYTQSCSFLNVHCGYGEWWTRPLPWEIVSISVNPMMRCYGAPAETFYSYSFSIQSS